MEYHQHVLTDIDFNKVSRHSYFPWMDLTLSHFHVNALDMEINQATFRVQENYNDFEVMINHTAPATSVCCNCLHTGFCRHQKAALSKLFTQENWLAFFDANRYNDLLKKVAAQYGLEDEPALENYFSAHIKAGKLDFVLKDKQLTSIDDFDLMEESIASKSKTPIEQQHHFVVLTRNKYYKNLQVLLCRASLTKSGMLKNPISDGDIQTFLWRSRSIEEMQFYTAVLQLSQVVQQDLEIISSLKAIAKNPLRMDFYLHDYEQYENITASSLSAVQLNLKKGDIKLFITKKDSFYTIKGEINVHTITYKLQDLMVVMDHFIFIRNQLCLIENKLHLKLIRLFTNKGEQLLIHQRKFKEFNSLFLEPLANSVDLHFRDIPKANKPQLKENLYYEDMQPVLFLEESEDFVNLIPVMRYGEVEIPILSKRNIFGTDSKGNQFLVDRKHEAETNIISLLLKQHPYFEEQMDDGSFQHFYLHRRYFLDKDWFLDAFDAWQHHGIQIIGFNTLRGNQLSRFKGKIHIEVLSGQNWFNAHIQVKFGPKSVSLKKLEKAVRNRSQFTILDDGTQGILPQEWLDKFEAYFNAAETITDDFIEIPKYKFNEIDHLFEQSEIDPTVVAELSMLRSRLTNFSSFSKLQIPSSFVGNLRPYQQEGVQWLHFLDGLNFGSCLADDMGLGKTIQILAFLATQKGQGQTAATLLVLPTTLIFNWQHEIQQFLPSFEMLLVDGPNSLQKARQPESYDLILISYHNLLTAINMLKKIKFNYVILDESQQIKNPDSQRYKTVNLLQSRNRIILTGTPIENNTMDLYAQISFIVPGLLGSKKYFKDVYTTPIDAFHDRKRKEMLKEKVKPFILRRTKQDVLRDLPAKNELVLYCEMKSAQRRIYDLYEKEFREFISAKDGDEIRKSPMHVLKGLTKLRQICNSSKLLQNEELTSTEDSAKIEMLMEQIVHKKERHKIIVFSQFVTMLNLIKEALDKQGIRSLMLTGKSKNRGQLVSDFQNDKDIPVFLVSLKAGGTGLNLVAADVVYLVDPWWNPAVEQQAIDRIYRMGQQKTVTAVRLISPNTVEDKIQTLQQHKKEISKSILDEGGSLDTFYLDKSYLMELLG